MVLVIGLVTGVRSIRADWNCNDPGSLPLEAIAPCMSKISGILDAISKANSTNQAQLNNLNNQITALKGQIASLGQQLQKLSQDIFDQEVQMGVKQQLLAAKVRQDYITKSDQSIFMLLFSSDGAVDFFQGLALREKLAAQDREIIGSIAAQITDLKNQSDQLATQEANLSVLKDRVNAQATFLAGEVAKANAYVADLGSQISALTARQQEILAERQGAFYTSVGDVPLADDPASRPDYNPGFSPAYAVFSFGAPHFKGMSQYGAFGRAKDGQSAEDILHAYYGGGIQIQKDYPTNINITVQGYGTVDIETYVKRIYEMPAEWGGEGGMEALKAQAVAARSYALAYTNNGAGSICATEACQVYKRVNKGGNWDAAVDATRGWVLIANGKPFSAWYASTSGGYQQSYTANGYTTPGFWDTPSGRSGWTSQAFENQAGSPWFYKGWYRTRDGDSCGRSSPWLTQEEMVDIINAWAVLKNGNDDRVSPIGSCWGGNPYSMAELRDKGGYTSISGVSVSYSDGGYTANVHFDTNKGRVDINGSDFKNVFNLRAPGRISAMSGLFNIESK